MIIRSIRHKALLRLMKAQPGATVRGLDPQAAKKIRRMVATLEADTHPNNLRSDHPGWAVHELTPGQPGKWAMTVTGNYRLTFRFDEATQEMVDLDYEDYH